MLSRNGGRIRLLVQDSFDWGRRGRKDEHCASLHGRRLLFRWYPHYWSGLLHQNDQNWVGLGQGASCVWVGQVDDWNLVFVGAVMSVSDVVSLHLVCLVTHVTLLSLAPNMGHSWSGALQDHHTELLPKCRRHCPRV